MKEAPKWIEHYKTFWEAQFDSLEQFFILKRIFPAPCEKVFEAWKDPEKLRQWFGPNKFTVPEIEVDYRVGGSYSVIMQSPEGEQHHVAGSYQEIIENKKIVKTWIWQNGALAGVETTVTIEFIALDNKAEVVLTHEGFPNEDVAGHHNKGWTSIYDNLEQFCKQ